jgi:hypothetical protein
MLKVGDKVRHINFEINNLKGVMSILEIKNYYAVCGYLDYSRMNLQPTTYLLSELIKEQ